MNFIFETLYDAKGVSVMAHINGRNRQVPKCAETAPGNGHRVE